MSEDLTTGDWNVRRLPSLLSLLLLLLLLLLLGDVVNVLKTSRVNVDADARKGSS
jgi:hypothetical protein